MIARGRSSKKRHLIPAEVARCQLAGAIGSHSFKHVASGLRGVRPIAVFDERTRAISRSVNAQVRY